MSNKLDKYGLKFWVLFENESKYVIAIQPYLGKDETANPTENLSIHVVQSLLKSAGLGPSYNITADNFLSSFELVSWLLEKKISYVGTLRSDRVDVCPQMRKRKSIHQCEYFYYSMFGAICWTLTLESC